LKENRLSFGGRPVCKQCNFDKALPRLVYDDVDPDKKHENVRYQLICVERFKYAMGGNRNKLVGDHTITFFGNTMPLMSHPDSNFRQVDFQKRSLHGWFKIQSHRQAGDPPQPVNIKGTIARVTTKTPWYIGDDNEDESQNQLLLGYEYKSFNSVENQ